MPVGSIVKEKATHPPTANSEELDDEETFLLVGSCEAPANWKADMEKQMYKAEIITVCEDECLRFVADAKADQGGGAALQTVTQLIRFNSKPNPNAKSDSRSNFKPNSNPKPISKPNSNPKPISKSNSRDRQRPRLARDR